MKMIITFTKATYETKGSGLSFYYCEKGKLSLECSATQTRFYDRIKNRYNPTTYLFHLEIYKQNNLRKY